MGRQCIAFPQREKKSKERSTLRRSETSQMKRTERRPERAEADGIFCTFGNRLVPFPQNSSVIHKGGDI